MKNSSNLLEAPLDFDLLWYLELYSIPSILREKVLGMEPDQISHITSDYVVNVYKPVSSKAGNSEQYIVCVGFKGRSVITDVHLNKLKQGFNATFSNRSLFPMASIPESFWAQLAECSLKFSTYQIHAIEENLRLYVCMKNSERKLIKEVKDICCEKFIERCKLKKLPRDKGILPSLHLDGVHGLHAVSLPVVSLSDAVRDRRTTGSFISRMTAIQRPWADTVQSIKLSGENYSVSTTGLSDAGKLVIHCLGYTGTGHEDEGIGSIDKEQSLSAIAVEPDDVFWLKSRHIQKSFDKQNLHTLDGKRVEKVTNSKFCSNESLRKLTGIIDKAEIIQSSNMADFAHIVSKSIPCHALLASNPPFYLNAEALNLAALDSLTGVVSQITVASEQCLSFVDLWGGPSGYGQYVYWTKCSHSIQGWGVVRSEVRSLHPSPMLARFVQWDTFQILGSVQGLNIVSNDTVNSIVAAVQSECPEGVQLVIGDVSSLPFGSHPPGNEECHTKQQFLTQCVCALKLMSHGGSFVCRLYSLLTRFSAALLYLLHSVFHEVALIKPITSSPVSPEQFIVCKGYVGCPTIICDLLLEVNNHISDLKQHQGYGHSGSTSDVLEIIPVQQLFDDTFYQYLASHNERMLKLQAHTLLKLEKYYLEPQVLSRDDISEKLKLGMLELLKLPKQIM
ncbi:PREDICTED: cap-specific mRNA (nucleoside-2'-O-)-methyltransferase 1-like isoform X2 [Amphimedon queenslandica]|uniref:Cap-specific mRNA (nucleoside-2'-O-)-methyltransferase 1 n=1 Tax=Amphimedon queenslandica TaxID=400682 RepID=A0AAN0JIL3_AMPQE|nr:PREDICTED: cap-specific mRNA (nucleoside-2'-O-)-methyltransferase 1-like isoform X2 [Amphimedon queenslandica]|eukprot:XP_019856804.1 PREDICTED: cap-specific mRNA (nucleoside-2'-O-)-methyltransferase 1-like isoform X2 [Amphimedon queenslandica]